jgi:hypothetical protein
MSAMATNPPTPSLEDLVALVERVEIFTRWVGFASPPSHASRLTITPAGGRFLRQLALAPAPDELNAESIAEFLAAVLREPVPQLDPALFDVPEAALVEH